MTTTDRIVADLRSGRPLTALSLRQSYGLADIGRVLWNVRIRGYHVRKNTIVTINKHTGIPCSMTEYRMEEQ